MSTPDTFFAPAERASVDTLTAEINTISQNPIVDGLMKSVSGLLAVLNEHRQVIGINNTLLDMLGLENPESITGLRLGEAVDCIHAKDLPNGCGTTEFCVTCGAAIAMVTSLEKDAPVTQECAITANRGDTVTDIYFRVISQPVNFNQRRFLLLFLHDITRQQQLAALERVFYHDIKNLIVGLTLTSEFMTRQEGDELRENAQVVYNLTQQLAKEVEIQRSLTENGIQTYQPVYQVVTTERIVQEVKKIVSRHPAVSSARLLIPDDIPDQTFVSDLSLVMRVLTNMLVNAAEASDEGEEIKLFIETSEKTIDFCVWNQQAIPKEIAKRVFQRNFSTKAGTGRGLGTYSMKLFGEKILQGRVTFSSSQEEGTTFCLTLPR